MDYFFDFFFFFIFVYFQQQILEYFIVQQTLNDTIPKKLPSSLLNDASELLFQYLSSVQFFSNIPKAFAQKLSTQFYPVVYPANSIVVSYLILFEKLVIVNKQRKIETKKT